MSVGTLLSSWEPESCWWDPGCGYRNLLRPLVLPQRGLRTSVLAPRPDHETLVLSTGSNSALRTLLGPLSCPGNPLGTSSFTWRSSPVLF